MKSSSGTAIFCYFCVMEQPRAANAAITVAAGTAVCQAHAHRTLDRPTDR